MKAALAILLVVLAAASAARADILPPPDEQACASKSKDQPCQHATAGAGTCREASCSPTLDAGAPGAANAPCLVCVVEGGKSSAGCSLAPGGVAARDALALGFACAFGALLLAGRRRGR